MSRLMRQIDKNMNIAIIGTGKIVEEALPVICSTEGISVRCLWSREHSVVRAWQLAKRWSIPDVLTDYDRVLADSSIDFVYIALINSVHYAYTLRALQAGKHVILEKPACLTADEFRQLAVEARSRQLYLFEAVTLLHLPAMRVLKDYLLPQIGTIRHIECNYSQRSSRMERYLQGDVAPALVPKVGGGALMDINIYNLHFVQTIMEMEPLQLCYESLRGFNDVDLSGTALLRYPSALAICTGTKDTDAPSFGLIQGERGWIRVEGPVSTMRGLTICLRGSAPEAIDLPAVTHRLAPEFAAFVEIFASKDYAQMDALLQHSIAVMEIVEKLRDQSLLYEG